MDSYILHLFENTENIFQKIQCLKMMVYENRVSFVFVSSSKKVEFISHMCNTT